MSSDPSGSRAGFCSAPAGCVITGGFYTVAKRNTSSSCGCIRLSFGGRKLERMPVSFFLCPVRLGESNGIVMVAVLEICGVSSIYIYSC